MDDPKQIILKILEIIDYQDDKEKFTRDFLEAIHKKTISHLVGSLNEEQKISLEEKLSGVVRSPEEISKVLFEFITEDQYQMIAKKVSGEIMRNYLETIAPSLSEDQTRKLDQYFLATAKGISSQS